MVREVLLLVVTNYVMNIRRRFNGSATFDSEIVAAKRVTSDSAALGVCFEAHLEALHGGGLRPAGLRPGQQEIEAGREEECTALALRETLQPLFILALLISARNVSSGNDGAVGEVHQLCALYGADGLKAAQAALLANPSIPKPERMQNFDAARRAFEQGPPVPAAKRASVTANLSSSNNNSRSSSSRSSRSSSRSSSSSSSSSAKAPPPPKARFCHRRFLSRRELNFCS